MENQPLSPEAAAKKAKAKAAHRMSMLGMGWFWVACAAMTAYLAFSKGDLPAFLYGHWRLSSPKSAVRKPASPVLVRWRDWNEDVIRLAMQEDRPIFLNIVEPWARSAHFMDETTYNDAKAADLLARRFIPVKVDAAARPDLALRYQAGGPATAAVLLPDGKLMYAGAVMPPAVLINWAEAIADSYKRNPAKINESYRKIVAVRGGVADAPPPRAVSPTEDPVWGGFFRGPGRYEKVLSDQLDVGRSWRYVFRFLLDPEGGYYAGQDAELKLPDGGTMESEHYYAQDETRRKSLGMPRVDRRFFAQWNGEMAAAVLDEKYLGADARSHALKTLERWWRRGIHEGQARRQMTSGVQGLLADQIGLASGFTAAFEATSEKRYLERAVALVRAVETRLMDEKSGALFDRPAWRELPPGVDQLLVPAQNLKALVLYRRSVRDLPVGDPFRERLKARGAAIARWLQKEKGNLSADQLARLSSDDYNGKSKE